MRRNFAESSSETKVRNLFAEIREFRRFLEKLLVQRNTKINKNIMALSRCDGDFDYNEIQIIRNFHHKVVVTICR